MTCRTSGYRAAADHATLEQEHAAALEAAIAMDVDAKVAVITARYVRAVVAAFTLALVVGVFVGALAVELARCDLSSAHRVVFSPGR